MDSLTNPLFEMPKQPQPERKTLSLRPYQQQCFERVLWSMENISTGNDIAVMPTASGKSIVVATLAHRLNAPVLILQPNKEILEQNLEKMTHYVDRSEIGVFSASMNERTINTYTFATIQSIYTRAELFAHFGVFIIDECHQVNPKSLDGMFSSFIKEVNDIRASRGQRAVKVVGFTATPYRMDTMYVNWGTEQMRVSATTKLINRMKGFFWQRIIFNLSIEELIEAGYLCRPDYIDMSLLRHEDMKLNKSMSDFDLDAYEDALTHKKEEIRHAIQYALANAKSVLVFCTSVRQATNMAAEYGAKSISVKTPAKEREAIINGFKDGSVKMVFNVGVLTTGFDHPALDCIVLLRPTRSLALYTQMIGRGLRISPGKTSCKVIDLTSTVKSMGKVESIKLIKREKWELTSEVDGKVKDWHGYELYSYVYTKAGAKAKPTNSLHAALAAVTNEHE